MEQKALDDSFGISSSSDVEATIIDSTSFRFPSPPKLTSTKNKPNVDQDKSEELVRATGDTPRSSGSATTKPAKIECSSPRSAVSSSPSARPVSQGSSSQKVFERPLPPLPPKPYTVGELASSASPEKTDSAGTRVTAVTSSSATSTTNPLTDSIGDFDLDAFPKPYHAKKNSAVTGLPLTALKGNKLSSSAIEASPTHVRSASSSADQFRPRTSSLPSAAGRQKQSKHLRSNTESEAKIAAKSLPQTGMGNKASRVATEANHDDGVPGLPKAVFKRKPVQANQPLESKRSTSAAVTAHLSSADASASGRAESRTSNINKALPRPATPSIISVQTSQSEARIAPDEKRKEKDGDGITTDMITNAFPSPPKSRSSPSSTPQLLPPPSPIPEDSPSKYGLRKVDSTEKKENELQAERKDDAVGKANMHIRGKSSTGLDIFRVCVTSRIVSKIG